MNRILAAVSFLVISASLAESLAISATPEDKIKSCLAIIYVSQKSFHEKKLTYASSFDDLSLAENPDCQGLQKTAQVANAEKFVFEVQDKNSTWTVDSSKTMRKIK